jgi:hypothetical protein
LASIEAGEGLKVRVPVGGLKATVTVVKGASGEMAVTTTVSSAVE